MFNGEITKSSELYRDLLIQAVLSEIHRLNYVDICISMLTLEGACHPLTWSDDHVPFSPSRVAVALLALNHLLLGQMDRPHHPQYLIQSL